MKRLLVAALAALALAGTAISNADAAFSGRWAVMPTRDGDQNQVQLRLEYSDVGNGHYGNSSWSSSVALADAGIPADKLRGPIGPVTFTIQREPGTFSCFGSAGEGSGAGQFTYAQSPHFDDALASRGLGRPDFRQSLELAIGGVTLAFIDQLRRFTQHMTTADVARAVEHGVTQRWVADLASVGYRVDSLDQLVRMRDHGVTTDMIKAVQNAGYRNLSPDDLLRLADHGVRERYITEMRAGGYTNLTADQLVVMRDHGISTDFIGELAAAGYKNLPADQLMALRDHGVSTRFIADLAAAGYKNLSVDDL
ncbi:MAG: hypothetical protein JO225_11020, partial [Candidatus Eremiobacteraeota bacterium]|nr:hypothetical protein [Candidatus Eremiobacteraeota bacterium]